MAGKHFNQILSRWKDIDRFVRALMKKLCEDMVEVLKQNSPGATFPTEWTFSISQSGSVTTAKVYNTRLGHDTLQGTNEGFLQIAIWHNDGTDLHKIAPVKAQALRWEDEAGNVYFSKGHIVSGVQARHFREKADRIFQNFEKTIDDKYTQWMTTGRLP